jgi:hypothetical protein
LQPQQREQSKENSLVEYANFLAEKIKLAKSVIKQEGE